MFDSVKIGDEIKITYDCINSGSKNSFEGRVFRVLSKNESSKTLIVKDRNLSTPTIYCKEGRDRFKLVNRQKVSW